ncbi:Predicted nicotinamide N-methyase [Devosia crocina]|uniref:Predicted nicotinamide N-methyase n=1 Tax=Devosia crocina TaxID=429728 RepID=A0A1I7NQX6_9HYPH|nr:50S ribosomal protein L11 methyltransferase [Devosia crocina]SFV37097.1 Predicted nicotinamide N-methyase [Devosia crocina]
MPVARLSADLATFIKARFCLTPLPVRPDISLYCPTPQSGLIDFLAAHGHAGQPPYWAYAWGGGAALALYLRDRPDAVAGRKVLDFGAGSGLVGIAAAKAGASKVWTLDPDPIAQSAMELNAEANGVALQLWAETVLPPVDIILAGDVFYDARVAKLTLPILAAAAEAGNEVLVGDPFRRDLPLDRLQVLARYEVPDMGSSELVKAGVFSLPGRTPS